MATFNDIRSKLKNAYKQQHSYRLVGEQFGISSPTARRIIEEDYEPKTIRIRLALGLPAYAPAPVCPKCGVVHLRKFCPKPRQYHDLYDMPVTALRSSLDNRVECGALTPEEEQRLAAYMAQYATPVASTTVPADTTVAIEVINVMELVHA
jgi:hypothetical protein